MSTPSTARITPKQPKVAIFDKTDFWGLKYPLEVRIQHETCSTKYGTPVPAILDHKNSTGSAGEARESQNALVNIDPVDFYGSKWLVQVSHIYYCMFYD